MSIDNRIKGGARSYGVFVSRHPYMTLSITIVLIILAVIFAGMIQSSTMDNQDMIPDGVDVIDVFSLVSEKFPGGTSSMRVAVELNFRSADYNAFDIREPAVLRYADVLSGRLELIEEVGISSTITDSIKQYNDGKIPNSLSSVKSTIGNMGPESENYISPEYDLLVITLSLTEDDPDPTDLYTEIMQAISEVSSQKPPYVDTYPVGAIVQSVEISSVMVNDMSTTTSVSLLVIFSIMILLFSSIRTQKKSDGFSPLSGIKTIFKSIAYTVSALFAVIVGILWAFGLAGAFGLPFTEIVSGAASMILGTGIDFGIQTVSRFRQEMIENGQKLEEAMGLTLAGIFIPLATTTVVGIIGFTAMGTGQLTIMRDLGTMMIYGIVSCLFAALLVVPTVLVFVERFRAKKRNGSNGN
jgi:uncharacterized protein